MKLFLSATLKLAGWYLLILMTVSLLFSGIIFQVARSEMNTQLNNLTRNQGFSTQNTTPKTNNADPKVNQDSAISANNLLLSLAYLNLTVLLGGGVCAYLLARRTLEPIEAAHEAQLRFTANASHQLRTPLAVIKAETELTLSDPKATKATLRQTLSSTLEETNRLSQLTTTLLQLSSANHNLETVAETFDIQELVSRLIGKHRAESRIQLSSPETVQLTSHRLIVRELIAIILDNALKHSPKESPIRVNISQSRNNIQLQITNDGQISSRDLPHIFERFFSNSPQPDSYGLGLSLARQLANTLGGQLSAQSRRGKTTFTITLPR